jgi:hypothetical protein
MKVSRPINLTHKNGHPGQASPAITRGQTRVNALMPGSREPGPSTLVVEDMLDRFGILGSGSRASALGRNDNRERWPTSDDLTARRIRSSSTRDSLSN